MIESEQKMSEGRAFVPRRAFLAFVASLAATESVAGALLGTRRFAFRVKTKDGSIVGNIVIEAKDVEAAKFKLYKRYPDCTILNVEEK